MCEARSSRGYASGSSAASGSVLKIAASTLMSRSVSNSARQRRHSRVEDPAKPAPPEVLAGTGGLQLARHRDRPYEVEVEPLKRRIVWLKVPNRLDGTPLKIPNIHSEHSRLK